MENFDLKTYLTEGRLLKESTPGFDTRKTGEPLPTLESVKAAYEAKKDEEKDLKENKRKVVIDPDEIMFHINQYQSGNIDGDDLAQAIEEILVAMMS